MSEENNIPKHWQVKTLSEIGKCVTGTTPPKNDSNNYGNDIPFVKPPQLFDKQISDAPEKLSKKGAGLARILPANSVLVTCIGNLGRTAINKIPVTFNQQINAIIPSKEIEGGYLFYQAQSHNFRKQLDELSSATTVAIVNKGKFETIKIVIPPLPEQQAIVSKIEELFSDLENGKQQLQLAQQQLKIYRQSMLKWAFEGKLTNNNVKEGELPKGWKVLKIEDAAISLDNRRKPINKDERLKRIGKIPYYGANGRVGWIDDFIFDEPLVCVVEDETFVGRTIPFSYKITGQTWVNNHAHILKPKENTNIDFLNYQLSYYPFLPITTGTTGRKKLTKNALMNAPIKICNLTEQQLIVDELESKLTVCDKIEETISQSLLQAESLRQSILKKAFEGKLI